MTEPSEQEADAPDARQAPDMPPEPLDRAFGFIAGVAALFTVVAFFLAGAREAMSVAIGGALVLFDSWALARIWRAILSDDPSVSRGLWVALALAKLGLLFGGLWLLLAHGVVSALGAAAGIAALPFGLVAFATVSPFFSRVSRHAEHGERGAPARKRDS